MNKQDFTPSNKLTWLILAGALICAVFSAVALGILALGVGARGRRISLWRVPLLCVAALLVSFGFGVFMLTLNLITGTAEHAALNVRIKVCALVMIAFGVFSLGSLIASLILAKRHNSRISIGGVG